MGSKFYLTLALPASGPHPGPLPHPFPLRKRRGL